MDVQHEKKHDNHSNNRVGGIHDSRAQKHTDRVHVISGSGHDVAGFVVLIVPAGESQQVRKKIIAQIIFNVARHSDHDFAHQEQKDSFQNSKDHNEGAVSQQFLF